MVLAPILEKMIIIALTALQFLLLLELAFQSVSGRNVDNEGTTKKARDGEVGQ